MTTFETRPNHRTYDTDTQRVVPVNSIVLNPDSGVVWGFLKDHEVDSPGAPRCFALAQEIRAQIAPQHIPEPSLWGVVEAGWDSPGITGIPRAEWVRVKGNEWMSCISAIAAKWSDLIEPVLVRPGIEDEPTEDVPQANVTRGGQWECPACHTRSALTPEGDQLRCDACGQVCRRPGDGA